MVKHAQSLLRTEKRIFKVFSGARVPYCYREYGEHLSAISASTLNGWKDIAKFFGRYQAETSWVSRLKLTRVFCKRLTGIVAPFVGYNLLTPFLAGN